MKNKVFINTLPIETKRLIIRPTSINDVNLLLKMDKQELTQLFLGGIKNKTKKERIDFLNKKKNISNKDHLNSLTIFLKDNTPIGFIELKINEIKNVAELSYIFDYDYTKKGYCTEASKKIIDIGFNILKLQYIYSTTDIDNSSSKRVLEKKGFKYINSSTKKNKKYLKYIIYNKKL